MEKAGDLRKTLGVVRGILFVCANAIFFTVSEYVANHLERSIRGKDAQSFQNG